MTTQRAPKQWCLSKTETISSFESWKQNLTYILALDPNFAPFLIDGVAWEKKSKANPLRGFTDDADTVPSASRKTATEKVTQLELMLGQIANFCPIISRNTIVKQSVSLQSIWQAIRLHFGFQTCGSHLIDFADIKQDPNERPEDLFQRLTAFVDDNLLQSGSNITHHGEKPQEDEEVSPTLENLIVLIWLERLHVRLPPLVKQKYGTELRSKTLASIKPEISQALPSLLEEAQSTDEACVSRSSSRHQANTQYRSQNKINKSCPLCKAAKRRHDHFLSRCFFLPDNDKQFMSKARHIHVSNDTDQEDDIDDDFLEHIAPSTTTRRVQIKQSPYFSVFCDDQVVTITLDSGAETNLIKHSVARSIGAKITKSRQTATQADGKSPLKIIGETTLVLTRNQHTFMFEGLVAQNMDVDILAGVPFMAKNDISIRPAKEQIILENGTEICYKESPRNNSHSDFKPHSVRRTNTHILRGPDKTTTVWPGDYIELTLPELISEQSDVAIEPHQSTNIHEKWPEPTITKSISSKVRIANSTNNPQIVKRNEHFCQVSLAYSPAEVMNCPKATTPQRDQTGTLHSAAIVTDPDNILQPEIKREFETLHSKYDNVFNPSFTGYNGASGPYKACVNMGPVKPPQRKGRLPQYNRDKLVELQEQFDKLESLGVFKRPEDINVPVEYVNPSFLVKKPNGNFRLVTAFTEVGKYAKPQPTVMPNIDATLREISQWKYIIQSDLTSAFYQIPLDNESMTYCGVVTPFKGVRTYARCAMGMPGSEVALDELLCRVLGDLLQEGIVIKLADDLFCGGDSPADLFHNWSRVLEAFEKNSLTLSAAKTFIAPKSTTILGWIWTEGTLRASPHRISTLSSCNKPNTVRNMRSFIGAYKTLSRVLPNCASYMVPLDNAIAGKQSADKIQWTDTLEHRFRNAQEALVSLKTIKIPRPHDQLWIVTDGALKSGGLGATLYATTQQGKPQLAGFFSAKLKPNQTKWIPCEIEALSIATAVKHFSPFIIQSTNKTHVLTDSKPCVQAYEKLIKGEFSASARLSTFLSVISRYQASVQHVAANANVVSDFASRNAPDCDAPNCQICSFANTLANSAVHKVTADDIISGRASAPFTSRRAWISTQQECSDLRRTHAHLTQGTRPSKKCTDVKDIKRYLQSVTIAKDGLLVVRDEKPMRHTQERIVIPRQVLNGVLTAMHIKLSHPSAHQLKCIANRYFYALDMESSIEQMTSSCHQCTSLKTLPKYTDEQTTCDPPTNIGRAFSADVMRRARQTILVLRENVTAFTQARIIDNERADTMREALTEMCVEFVPLDGPPAIIRTDNAPCFRALHDDKFLTSHRICIETGRSKNVNKNPIAEKAIQELQREIQKANPENHNQAISPLELTLAVANLNTRLRSQGLSARETMLQRDQFNNNQLPLNDRNLILERHKQRITNHPYSENSKQHKETVNNINISVGDIVYVRTDINKTSARDRYLVTTKEGNWITIKKFRGPYLRPETYRIKTTQCFKVPEYYEIQNPPPRESESDLTMTEISSKPNDDTQTTQVEHRDSRSMHADNIAPDQKLDEHHDEDEITTVEGPNHHNAMEAIDSEEACTHNEPVLVEAQSIPRRSSRKTQRPTYLDDYVVNIE